MNTTLKKTMFGFPYAVPGIAAANHELVDLAGLGYITPLVGGARGFNAEADVISVTADGRDINQMWTEFQQVVAIYNERRQRIIDLITFPVTSVIEDVPQFGSDGFVEASGFGLPVGTRAEIGYFSMAYDFKWYDLGAKYTWKFLAEASSQQLEAIHQQALEADSRLVFRKVMNALFRNTNREATIKGQNYTVFSLYNGDGTVPPEYKGNTFDDDHSHYMVSGSNTVDSGDLEALLDNITEHGFTPANGTTFLLVVNPQQSKAIRRFRANEENSNGAVALYDFIPAQGQPGLIVPNSEGLLGTQAPSTIRGLPVIGSYGPLVIAEEDYIPKNYMLLLASGGEGNLQNPVGIREHVQPQLRGLRLLAGNQQAYPLTESYYSRGFGTGIRQRGAAAIMQIKASGAYEVPAVYNR